MTNEMVNKVNEIMATEEFGKKFVDVVGVEEAVALFKEFGVEMTEAEFEEIMASIPDEEELDADSLEEVSGGVIGTLGAVITIAKGASIASKALKCNKHTNWGRNGKSCICGYHFF